MYPRVTGDGKYLFFIRVRGKTPQMYRVDARIIEGLRPKELPTEFPKLSGPYLGQRPPGMTPELFAPGIVCTGMMERDVAISPDGSEIYFGVTFGNIVTIMWTRLLETGWSEPEVAPFASDANYFHFEPALSADGRRIFLLTGRR